jgi:hypothetical protein
MVTVSKGVDPSRYLSMEGIGSVSGVRDTPVPMYYVYPQSTARDSQSYSYKWKAIRSLFMSILRGLEASN